MSEPVMIEPESVTIEVEDVGAELRAVEAWQAVHKVPTWQHAGACYLYRWGVGRPVTESEYLDAVGLFASHTIGRE